MQHNILSLSTTSRMPIVGSHFFEDAKEDDECILIYSLADLKKFIRFVETFEIQMFDAKSIQLDGQKAFIIKMTCSDDKLQECEEILESLFINISPTLLGCVDVQVPCKNETLKSIHDYIEFMESTTI